MWVLVVVSLLVYGTPQGATQTNFFNFYSKTACQEAADSLNKMSQVRAFCVHDDVSDEILKGLRGVERELDNSFGKSIRK